MRIEKEFMGEYSYVDVWVKHSGQDADVKLCETLARAAGWDQRDVCIHESDPKREPGMLSLRVLKQTSLAGAIDEAAESITKGAREEGFRVRSVQRDYGTDLLVLKIA